MLSFVLGFMRQVFVSLRSAGADEFEQVRELFELSRAEGMHFRMQPFVDGPGGRGDHLEAGGRDARVHDPPVLRVP